MSIGKKTTRIEVGYNEIEQLIHKELGLKHYSFACVQECSNGNKQSFDVDGEIDDYDRGYLQEWRDGKEPCYTTNILLNRLCELGLLEAGEYLVDCSW